MEEFFADKKFHDGSVTIIHISSNRSGYWSTVAMDMVAREGGGLLPLCETEMGCQVGDHPSPDMGWKSSSS